MGSVAQKIKDQGNAAFRAQRYAEAVGHYSAAIAADPTDSTLPLNRGFAYLKLGKFTDAERDCSTVLHLSPRHVKALYRRAQARTELDKLKEAKDDLEIAIQAEPNNEAVRAELLKIGKTLLERSEPRPSTRVNKMPLMRKRRVPIEIVETADESPTPAISYEAPLQSQSERNRRSAADSESIITIDLARDKSTEARQPEQKSMPLANAATAQGGIFLSSGHRKLFTVPDSGVRESTGSQTTDNTPKSARPSLSLFDFTRYWELASASERWDMLCKIPPPSIPSFFKTSLEAPLLAQIVQVCLEAVTSSNNDTIKSLVKEYLTYLSKVPRFSTISLFLSKREKEDGRRLGEIVGNNLWMRL